jgi:hypothetical protein
MKPDTKQPSEYDKFTNLVDAVLSVPKADVERIKSEPWPEEKKDRLLGHLREELIREESEKSQVCEPEPPLSHERRVQDLRYLREVLEEEERRNSQIIPIE